MMIALNTTRQRFCRNQLGASAVEFALLTPIILLILAAVMDLGLWINARTKLESALSSASTHVMASGQQANTDALGELTQTAVGILVQQVGEKATISATIDDAVRVSYAAGGYSTSGTESDLGRCFCPALQSEGFDWGPAQACGTPCPSSDAFSGRYMSLSVSAPYTSIFGSNVVKIDRVTTGALVNYQ